MTFRIPGPVCQTWAPQLIDDGTLARAISPVPGSLGFATATGASGASQLLVASLGQKIVAILYARLLSMPIVWPLRLMVRAAVQKYWPDLLSQAPALTDAPVNLYDDKGELSGNVELTADVVRALLRLNPATGPHTIVNVSLGQMTLRGGKNFGDVVYWLNGAYDVLANGTYVVSDDKRTISAAQVSLTWMDRIDANDFQTLANTHQTGWPAELEGTAAVLDTYLLHFSFDVRVHWSLSL